MVSKYRKICVTGGAGFIGSHLVDRLLDEGYEVIVIDNLSTGKLENINHNLGKENFQFVNCDIRDYKSIRGLIKNVDAIFHEAASIKVKTSIRNSYLMNTINITGTLNLLKAALDSHVKRFVYASSAAVYGNLSPPQREEAPTVPISLYGASKMAAENYVRVFHKVYGLETVCLRYFNVYGNKQSVDSPYSGVITKFIERLLRNKPLIIYGDGYQSRDFIHVQDVVEANMLALENNRAVGDIFNVGTARSTSINKLARILVKLMNNNSVKIIHKKAQSGDIKYSRADNTKVKKIMGFNPKYKLDVGLRKSIEWYNEIARTRICAVNKQRLQQLRLT